jgi:hypothetical protein
MVGGFGPGLRLIDSEGRKSILRLLSNRLTLANGDEDQNYTRGEEGDESRDG